MIRITHSNKTQTLRTNRLQHYKSEARGIRQRQLKYNLENFTTKVGGQPQLTEKYQVHYKQQGLSKDDLFFLPIKWQFELKLLKTIEKESIPNKTTLTELIRQDFETKFPKVKNNPEDLTILQKAYELRLEIINKMPDKYFQ